MLTKELIEDSFILKTRTEQRECGDVDFAQV